MAVPEIPSVKDTNGIVRFLREAKSELKKVTWPTRRELIAHTIVVFIAVVLSAILIVRRKGSNSPAPIWNQKNVGMSYILIPVTKIK